jgi:NAD-dependent deacetylase
MSSILTDTLHSALLHAHSVVAFTGAGISAESGVPTFRGEEGIWKKFKPEELANVNAFMSNPALVWEWYAHRKKLIASLQPNAGHIALARMQRLFPRFAVVTQNIDNLHRRAGSEVVYELHGNIEQNYCMKCGTPSSDEDVVTVEGIPRCRKCSGLVRPDVVWFGELLPEEEWAKSVRAVASCDVFFSIGTSGVVYPAASLPSLAKRNGAFIVEINPEATPLTNQAEAFLQGQAGKILSELADSIQRFSVQENPTKGESR